MRIPTMRTASIFAAFNARWLEPEEVARSFIDFADPEILDPNAQRRANVTRGDLTRDLILSKGIEQRDLAHRACHGCAGLQL